MCERLRAFARLCAGVRAAVYVHVYEWECESGWVCVKDFTYTPTHTPTRTPTHTPTHTQHTLHTHTTHYIALLYAHYTTLYPWLWSKGKDLERRRCVHRLRRQKLCLGASRAPRDTPKNLRTAPLSLGSHSPLCDGREVSRPSPQAPPLCNKGVDARAQPRRSPLYSSDPALPTGHYSSTLLPSRSLYLPISRPPSGLLLSRSSSPGLKLEP